MAFTVTGTYNPYVECEICLEPWHDPVELAPCDHIFCRQCIAKCWQCPDCRAEITGKHTPSVVLTRIAARAEIRCDLCQWTGTRADQTSHLTACPKGLGLAAAAFGGGGGAASRSTDDADKSCDVVIKRRQSASNAARANVPQTPTQPNHADPARPWRTYTLTQRQFVRAANAFKDHATGSAPPMCLESVEAMQGFLHATGLFGEQPVTKRDAAVFFTEADINRVGAVPLHFALGFVGLNRPTGARARRSYRYGGDAAADDDDDEEEEEEEEDPAACVVGFGKEPEIAKGVAAMPDVDSIGGGGSGGGGGGASSSHLGGLGSMDDFGIGGIDTGISSRHAGGGGGGGYGY